MKKNGFTMLAVIVTSGTLALTGCGGKNEVKPQITPVAAAPSPTATPETKPATQRYTVVKGDSLWVIAGRSDIYADHFQWPLIYKTNRDQIQDPDIIEVGQDFAISHEFSSEEVAKAVENAKKTPRYVPHKKPRKHLPIEY